MKTIEHYSVHILLTFFWIWKLNLINYLFSVSSYSVSTNNSQLPRDGPVFKSLRKQDTLYVLFMVMI